MQKRWDQFDWAMLSLIGMVTGVLGWLYYIDDPARYEALALFWGWRLGLVVIGLVAIRAVFGRFYSRGLRESIRIGIEAWQAQANRAALRRRMVDGFLPSPLAAVDDQLSEVG